MISAYIKVYTKWNEHTDKVTTIPQAEVGDS